VSAVVDLLVRETASAIVTSVALPSHFPNRSCTADDPANAVPAPMKSARAAGGSAVIRLHREQA